MQITETDNLLSTVVTNPNLTVKIVGLALFKLEGEDKHWEVFFPQAPAHPFKLIIKKTISLTDEVTNEFVLPPASVIDFVPDDKKGIGVEHDSVKPNPLSIYNLHKNHHGEDIAFSIVSENYAGFLKLYGTTLVREASKDMPKFAVWDAVIDPKTNLVETKTRVNEKIEGVNQTEFAFGNILTAGFNIDSDQTAKIRIKNALGFDLELPFAKEGVSYEIIFSNDCAGVGCNNMSDFKHYYLIVDHAVDENKNPIPLKGKFEVVSPDDVRGDDGSCSPVPGGGIYASSEFEKLFK